MFGDADLFAPSYVRISYDSDFRSGEILVSFVFVYNKRVEVVKKIEKVKLGQNLNGSS